MVGGTDGFEHLLKVTVLEVNGQNVRLGFEVDESVPVHRWEVWERIRLAAQPIAPEESCEDVRTRASSRSLRRT
jgi:carbon storage regulator CsrA